MQENRTKNFLKNSIFGFFNKLINILMPFVTRTVIIYALGMQYAGLNSLFSSVLQVLNLAELGISTAVVYCMYKPLAESNKDLICALLRFMRKLYYKIGVIVVALGVVFVPFLPDFINGSVPDNLSITWLYGIYLINSGIGYFFFAYKSTLLNAGQKVGVISNINSVIIFFQSIAQIFAVVYFKNYYLFVGLMPVFTIINNICISIATHKYYPDIESKGELSKEIQQDISTRVKGLFVTRICTTTRNAFDSIFISAFIDLTTVAIYGNYYCIMSAVNGILSVITTAMTASVGNSLVTKSAEKNYGDLRKLNFIFNWIVGWCTCCLLTMYQPFMKVWMGETLLFPFSMVILICVYFYFLNIGSIRAVYHDAAGLWWEARYRAIFEAILNLLLNFLLTRWLGVFGTVLGTLISLIIINYGWGTKIVFKYYFKTISVKQYFIDNGIYSIITVIGCAVTYFLSSRIQLHGLVGFIVPFVLSLLVFNGVYLAAVFKTKLFSQSKELFLSVVVHPARNQTRPGA